MNFSKDVLIIDPAKATENICAFIRHEVESAKREGAVVGLSGGIDSAVTVALCTRALGKDKVLGLILPEKDSSPLSAELAKRHASKLGIKTETVEITGSLESFGVYSKRDTAYRSIYPDYKPQYKSKIVLPANILDKDAFNFYRLVIDDGTGEIRSARLDLKSFRHIVAATNIKQRTRMIELYYAAESKNYLVCGTTNRTETVQGFFVKYGDGGVDIEPIAGLYKVQVFQIADHLGVMEEIINRVPTADTYSLEASDEEFYFRIPYDTLDLLLYAWEHKISIPEVCRVMGLEEAQVKRVFRDFVSKFDVTKHLRTLPPSLDPLA